MKIIEHIANLSVLFRYLLEDNISSDQRFILEQQKKQMVRGISILDNYIDDQSKNNLIEHTINDMAVSIRNITETIVSITRKKQTNGIHNEILFSIACLSKLVVDAKDIFDKEQNKSGELIVDKTTTTLTNNQLSWKQNSTH